MHSIASPLPFGRCESSSTAQTRALTGAVFFEIRPFSNSNLATRGQNRQVPNKKPIEKLTQYLTLEEGKPRLKEMLEGVKTVMRLSKDKHDFWEKMDVAYPKLNGDNLLLPFVDLPRLGKPK